MNELTQLEPAERLARIRELASEAEATASAMKSPLFRAAYLKISRDWRRLAQDLESALMLPDDVRWQEHCD